MSQINIHFFGITVVKIRFFMISQSIPLWKVVFAIYYSEKKK